MSCKDKICPSLKKYTNGLICLLVLTTFLTITTIYLVFSPAKQPVFREELVPERNICLTETCIRSAASILKLIDKNIDPCDDFYQFVCGNFIKNTAVPDEKTVIRTFSLVNEKVDYKLRQLLEQPTDSTDSKTLTLLKTAYKSCMNTSLLETDSLTFLKKIFKELGGWPVIDPNWNERKFEWKHFLYRLRRIGWNFNIFVKMFLDLDLKNSSRRILTITQPSFTSNYQMLRKGINHSDTQAYYHYMVKIVTHFGAPRLSASVEMNEVLKFEMHLSKILIPYSVRHNVSTNYNPTTIKNLQKEIYTIPWLQLINNFLAPMEMLTSEDLINVAFPKYLKHLEDLLLNTKKRILANYLCWFIVRSSVNHLPEKFKYQALEYHKKVRGVKRDESRWQQCIKEMDKLHVATSSVYVKHFFNQKHKEAVTDIALYVKDAFIETLKGIKWMDSNTKAHALLKAKKMSYFIAFPEEILDEDKVEEYHRELVLDPKNHYLKLNLNISSFVHQKEVRKLREPVVKHDWTCKRYTQSYYVNGFYNHRANTIIIMAALLHDHFFDSGRPQCLNFGSIGEVIGHEITHGFDDYGKQFDENGNLDNWWAPKTLKTFKEKSDCFMMQYSNLTVPEIGMKINGANTFDENIADNGGYKIAYQAYLKWAVKNGEELELPGVSFTPRQLFWISAASDGCAVFKKEALKRFVASGHHAPEYFRVVVPFSNSEDFSRDFGCPVGSRMNPEKKCQLW